MSDKEQKQKFPSEIVDLPSGGKVYPKNSPISNGKIELKYMTAREEDILTSQNLIKKGEVIEKVLDSLILTEGVKCDDLIIGDKNAIMVAARILAYGPIYEAQVTNPNTGDQMNVSFDLTDCPFKKVPDISGNNFEFELPISKKKIQYQILTGKEEEQILDELKKIKKINKGTSPTLTTRLRHSILSVDGDDSHAAINDLSINMLARDSLAFREELKRVSPDIDLEQEVELEGEMVTVQIPMTATFFWPNSKT